MIRKISICIALLSCFFLSNVQENTTILIAGSDYQGETNEESSNHVKEIIDQIKEDGYDNPDGLLFVGDYSILLNGEAKDSNDGIASLKNTFMDSFPTLEEYSMVLSQGNHDVSSTNETINTWDSGLYTFDSYYVYIINEKDYPWEKYGLGGSYYEEIAKNTAQNLKESLKPMIEEQETKPIFVLCHIPLHVTVRTDKYGDGEYGRYIFDVLNQAGEEGLNIFFLYGHNHSSGCENYLGGAAVYLDKGDEILIPKIGTKTGEYASEEIEYTKEILHFTYMNAGYTGYFSDGNSCDTCLSMTTFEIDDTKVEIRRYSKDGLHELKSKGEANNAYPKEANTDVYSSKQIVFLNKYGSIFKNLMKKIIKECQKIGINE